MKTVPALRLATPDDVETLADAWYAMLEEDRLLAPEIDERWRSYITADFRTGIAGGSQVWVVAEDDGRIAATGAAFFRGGRSSLALTGLTANLAGVYTFPEFRRRGFARARRPADRVVPDARLPHHPPARLRARPAALRRVRVHPRRRNGVAALT